MTDLSISKGNPKGFRFDGSSLGTKGLRRFFGTTASRAAETTALFDVLLHSVAAKGAIPLWEAGGIAATTYLMALGFDSLMKRSPSFEKPLCERISFIKKDASRLPSFIELRDNRLAKERLSSSFWLYTSSALLSCVCLPFFGRAILPPIFFETVSAAVYLRESKRLAAGKIQAVIEAPKL